MESVIKSGKNGNTAEVDGNGRLLTESVTLSTSLFETEKGWAFNINTGLINLTSANKSAVLYLKNNEDEDLIIKDIFYIFGNSTGGTGDMIVEIRRNPTAGTIVDNALGSTVVGNRNHGSTNSLDMDFYKGVEGDTFTDGEVYIYTILSSAATRVPLTLSEISIPRGSSIGIEVTPQASNTSMNMAIAFAAYKVTLTV